MTVRKVLGGFVVVLGAAFLLVHLAGVAYASDTPERCGIGDAVPALNAFYPGIFAVNEFGIDENGDVVWIVQRQGGLGHGVSTCNFRLFAAFPGTGLPDRYTFCAGDVFLGGNVYSVPYKDPAVQALLDLYHPDVNGYRNKGKAEIELVENQSYLTRLTYFDAVGVERPLGDGGEGDPVTTDPTAGEPKAQEMLTSAFRDFFGGPPGPGAQKLIQRQMGFLGQLEAGTYRVDSEQYFDGTLVAVFPPIELAIVPCD